MIAAAVEENAALGRRRYRSKAHAHREIIAGTQFEPGVDLERESAVEQFAIGQALDVFLCLRLNVRGTRSGTRTGRHRLVRQHPRKCARSELFGGTLITADTAQALDEIAVEFRSRRCLGARDPAEDSDTTLPVQGARTFVLVRAEQHLLPLDLEEGLQFRQSDAGAAMVHEPVDHAQRLGRREPRLLLRKRALTRAPDHDLLRFKGVNDARGGPFEDTEVAHEPGCNLVHAALEHPEDSILMALLGTDPADTGAAKAVEKHPRWMLG